MLIARLESDMYQFYKTSVLTRPGTKLPNHPHLRPVLYQFWHRAHYAAEQGCADHIPRPVSEMHCCGYCV